MEKLIRKYQRGTLIKIAGAIGILLNVFISVIKIFIGMIANSVAILSDAVNNLTDALSSVVTLVGLRLSQKAPDKKHPFGYGRIEYLSAMIIAVIVCVAGFEFLKTSFERILHPSDVSFSVLQLVILSATILIKVFLSRLNIAVGKAANSAALEASGAEAMIDVLASAVTIVAAVISLLTGWKIDGYVGVLLSAFILYTGINLIKETLGQIIGIRPEKELVDSIRNDLKNYEHIQGVYDFIIHNYGPVYQLGTANLEFADTLNAKELHKTMQKAQKEIYDKHHVYFTFGLYAVNTIDQEVIEIHDCIQKLLAGVSYVVGFHALAADKEQKTLSFDVVVDFTVKDFKHIKEEIKKLVEKTCPDYMISINIDLDYA